MKDYFNDAGDVLQPVQKGILHPYYFKCTLPVMTNGATNEYVLPNIAFHCMQNVIQVRIYV